MSVFSSSILSPLHLTPYTLHCSSAARLLAKRYKNMLQRLGIYSPRRVAVLLPHEMLLNHVLISPYGSNDLLRRTFRLLLYISTAPPAR